MEHPPPPPPRGVAAFSALARLVLRRPWVVVVLWIVLLLVALPFLSRLGYVTTSSTQSLPANAPSAAADAELARLFPSENVPASSILLFVGPNLTGAQGQLLLLHVTTALAHDRALVDVASIESVYTAYASFLAEQTSLAADAIALAERGSPNVTTAVQAVAAELWGPPQAFLQTWGSLVNNSTGPPSAENAPAYNTTLAGLGNSSAEREVLNAFYAGTNASMPGFNVTGADCASGFPNWSEVVACADGSARSNLFALLPSLPGMNVSVGQVVLASLGAENATNPSAQLSTASTLVGGVAGFPSSWIRAVWATFPAGPPTAREAASFANGTVANSTLSNEPLPVPASLSASFVNAAGTASLVLVGFSVDDGASNATGGAPVDHDLSEIDRQVGLMIATFAPGGNVRFYQTGPAPLDELSSEAVSSSLALVLPLTVGLLLGITMIYFRSPVAALAAFAGLAIALVLGLGGTVLVGSLVTHVDSTAIVLEEVFVLGVGTDYSIFLLARYREELVRGRSSEEAIVGAVTWAGQSIATSGSTAIIVTIALTFSGVALLSQWGMVLSIAILITLVAALTLLPAVLRLLGPRVLWPMTGDRFRRVAAVANERTASRSTYFYRAARAAERRPVLIVGAIVLVSVPLVAVALQAPISYDFYDQLPAGHEATQGLSELGQEFGPGFSVPSYALVTFATPLVFANTSNGREFSDVGTLTAIASASSGIAQVRSPVGPFGASLASWDQLANASFATRTNLMGVLGNYLGDDGRTVLFRLQTSGAGLSLAAVRAIDGLRASFDAFGASHPEVAGIVFGGGAPSIEDIANQTALATEVMLVAVTIGLIVVLLAVLRSWIIALMAVATIGLSISWAWAASDLVLQQLFSVPLFFYVRTILIMLVLGLGIDYNIFLLTRVREERLRGRSAGAATGEAVGRTGGIITAAAIILASAFAALLAGEFTLIRSIGFAVAVAVTMDAMVVRTYLVPASLQLLGDRAWKLGR